jgi:hypothetical protein
MRLKAFLSHYPPKSKPQSKNMWSLHSMNFLQNKHLTSLSKPNFSILLPFKRQFFTPNQHTNACFGIAIEGQLNFHHSTLRCFCNDSFFFSKHTNELSQWHNYVLLVFLLATFWMTKTLYVTIAF